ncbi:hypothetical protein GCM10017687_78360 [Streptomyces echinatus]|uniref:MASE1 domain-containing protein n=1 Tax=Streptomyces echinatus TaxID=67293 RepID=UPI0031EC7491
MRGQVTPLWPPSVIALAGLLLCGPRVWPGVALGAFLANVGLGPSLPGVLAITAGNTLAPVCSYLLLRRTGFRVELDRLRDALALIFLGAFTGMLISATTGSGTLLLAGALNTNGFWPTWSVWWTGDAMGVLVVTPVLLVLRSARWPRHVPPSRWLEALLLMGGHRLHRPGGDRQDAPAVPRLPAADLGLVPLPAGGSRALRAGRVDLSPSSPPSGDRGRSPDTTC